MKTIKGSLIAKRQKISQLSIVTYDKIKNIQRFTKLLQSFFLLFETFGIDDV